MTEKDEDLINNKYIKLKLNKLNNIYKWKIMNQKHQLM